MMQHDFSKPDYLLPMAKRMMKSLREDGISKYNNTGKKSSFLKRIGINSSKNNILVIGQVEDDLSLGFGMRKLITGNELVTIAARENPHSRILYRPHPESIRVRKKHYSNPKDVEHICDVIPQAVTLKECFSVSNKVYCMTSLAGFEAALHGLKVKTFGLPFYAGWGFTEDVDPRALLRRNKRRLTVEEVFAAAYILYPRYFDPIMKEFFSAEDALAHISGLKKQIVRLEKMRT